MPSRACEHCKLLMKLINKELQAPGFDIEATSVEFAQANSLARSQICESQIPCVARRTRMIGRKACQLSVLPDLQSLSTQGHTGDA